MTTTPSQARPSDSFLRFIRFVQAERLGADSLTIKDLRLAVRTDRMTEVSVWTFDELDKIHVESLSYDDDILLKDVALAQTSSPELQTA